MTSGQDCHVTIYRPPPLTWRYCFQDVCTTLMPSTSSKSSIKAENFERKRWFDRHRQTTQAVRNLNKTDAPTRHLSHRLTPCLQPIAICRISHRCVFTFQRCSRMHMESSTFCNINSNVETNVSGAGAAPPVLCRFAELPPSR